VFGKKAAIDDQHSIIGRASMMIMNFADTFSEYSPDIIVKPLQY